MRQIRRIKEPDPPTVELYIEAQPRKPVSWLQVLGCTGATVAGGSAVFFIWTGWLSAKKSRMEDKVQQFFEAQMSGADQSANFEKYLYESRRDEYLDFVQSAGSLESYKIDDVVLKSLFESGGANISTVRNSVSFNEHFYIKDDNSKFAFSAATDENGQWFDPTSND